MNQSAHRPTPLWMWSLAQRCRLTACICLLAVPQQADVWLWNRSCLQILRVVCWHRICKHLELCRVWFHETFKKFHQTITIPLSSTKLFFFFLFSPMPKHSETQSESKPPKYLFIYFCISLCIEHVFSFPKIFKEMDPT